MDSVFQGSEAKRELKCFHGIGISSLLFWAEVALATLCKTAAHEQKHSQLSCEQTEVHVKLLLPVTRFAEWRNNICCLWRGGSGKRRGKDKSESKFCPFLKSQRKSEHFTVFKCSKNPCPEILGKKDASHFPLKLVHTSTIKNTANTEPGDRHEPGL